MHRFTTLHFILLVAIVDAAPCRVSLLRAGRTAVRRGILPRSATARPPPGSNCSFVSQPLVEPFFAASHRPINPFCPLDLRRSLRPRPAGAFRPPR